MDQTMSFCIPILGIKYCLKIERDKVIVFLTIKITLGTRRERMCKKIWYKITFKYCCFKKTKQINIHTNPCKEDNPYTVFTCQGNV